MQVWKTLLRQNCLDCYVQTAISREWACQPTLSDLQRIPLLQDRIQASDFTETLMKRLGRTPGAFCEAKELHTGQRLLDFASYSKADVKAEGFASPRDYNIYCFLSPLCWMRPRCISLAVLLLVRMASFRLALWWSSVSVQEISIVSKNWEWEHTI